MTRTSNEAQTRAWHVVGGARDTHGWRARSLVEALEAMAEAGGMLQPSALGAIAERLAEHVAGLDDALGEAAKLLRTGSPTDAAAPNA